jgi:GNAT superfamily N-acetyltransferase
MRARPATFDDVETICRICADSSYTPERVAREVDASLPSWGGWFVAFDDLVIAAGAGGMTGAHTGELFVLSTDPSRRGEGAGTAVLRAITQQQLALGATEQWVSVALANRRGIAFYEARGFVRRGAQPVSASGGASARYWRSLPRQGSGNPPRSS